MPIYQHDIMHCHKEQCTQKDKCYRFWLSQNMTRFGRDYAYFYCPSLTELRGECEMFLDLNKY